MQVIGSEILTNFLDVRVVSMHCPCDYSKYGCVWKISVNETSCDFFGHWLQHFKGLSFETISSVGGNAAIIHYAAKEETCAEMQPDSMYLCDSGGQVRCTLHTLYLLFFVQVRQLCTYLGTMLRFV